MDRDGHHEVARIDETVTPDTLHDRAERVAVPDFDYLTQTIEGMAEGLAPMPSDLGHRHRPGL